MLNSPWVTVTRVPSYTNTVIARQLSYCLMWREMTGEDVTAIRVDHAVVVVCQWWEWCGPRCTAVLRLYSWDHQAAAQTCSSQVVITPLFWTISQCWQGQWRNVQPVRKVQLHLTYQIRQKGLLSQREIKVLIMIIASSDLTGCNKWGEVKVTSWESFIFHHRLLCFASSLSSKHSIIDATHQTITSHGKGRWKVSINTCEEECWFRQGWFFLHFWIIG